MKNLVKVSWALLGVLGGCSGGSDNNGAGGAGGAAGAGGAGGGTAPVTIVAMRNDNPPYVKASDDAFAAYKAAHPNVTILDSTLRYPSLTSTLLAQLKTDSLTVAVDGKQQPVDLVFVPPSWVCTFADNLADVPAEVVSLSEAQNTFFAAPLAGSTCKGKLKGLPQEYNLEYGGVVVNLDKYQAKHPGAQPAWTDWRSFIADASDLTEFDGGKPMANGLDIAPDWPQPVKHIFFSLILQKGGDYWSAKGDHTFDFSTPAAKQALTEMVKWIATDHVMYTSLIPDKNTFVTTRLAGGATGYGWGDPAKPLSVMGYAGSWALPNTTGQLPMGSNVKYGYYALPPMAGTEHNFVQNSGFAWVVPKTSKNQKVAWDVAKLLTLSPDASRKWTTTGGALPALKVNGTPTAAASDPLLAKVQPLLEKGKWVGYIPAGAIENVEGAIVSNYFDAVKGQKSIDQALADMQATANDALAKAK
jgi:multiple sugar transport system substrate-binding protein